MKSPELTLKCDFDCDGNPYFTARYDEYGVVGGGNTPSEAVSEAEANLAFYLETLDTKEE